MIIMRTHQGNHKNQTNHSSDHQTNHSSDNMSTYNTIAESNNFIVLDRFSKYAEVNEAPTAYQTEAALEKEFIHDLIHQGYENPVNLNTPGAMLANVRVQLQALNNMAFSDAEWLRFVEEYLDMLTIENSQIFD